MQRPFWPLFLLPIFVVACGKKAPPQPPPPPPPPSVGNPTKVNATLAKGKGGYFLGDKGFAVLYWQFPVEVDYSVIRLNNKTVGSTEGITFLYPQPLEKGKTYTFRVLGVKGNKPVAEVEIKVSP